MSQNKKSHAGPKFGVAGQSQECGGMKGGYNDPGKPFGYPSGSAKNAQPAPQHGSVGQRLASTSSSRGHSYPPGRRR